MSPRCIKGHDCDHPIACPTCFPPPTAASEMNRYVDAAEREAGENARLRAEVRALRRERRALRKAVDAFMRADVSRMTHPIACMNADLCVCGLKSLRLALKPRKARRRKA